MKGEKSFVGCVQIEVFDWSIKQAKISLQTQNRDKYFDFGQLY